MHVNIFCQSGIRTMTKSRGYVIYLLETELNGTPYTKHWIEELEETANGAGVETVRRALSKLRMPGCELTIYTDSVYFETNIERAREWQKAGWVDDRGTEYKHRDKWEDILRLLSPHTYRVSMGDHAYTSWLVSELNRKQLKTA